MKLPDNKKERMQMLMLLAIVGVAVLYAVFQFGIRPVLKNKKELTEKTADLERLIKDARMLVAPMAAELDESRNALLKVKEYSDKYFLKPRLGENYQLGASEQVDLWAGEAGIQKTTISAIGKVPVAQAEAARRIMSVYVVRIRVQCDTQQIIHFLKIIEESNPFVNVNALSITAQPGNPTQHVVEFAVEWPVWTDPSAPVQLEELIKAASSRQ